MHSARLGFWVAMLALAALVAVVIYSALPVAVVYDRPIPVKTPTLVTLGPTQP